MTLIKGVTALKSALALRCLFPLAFLFIGLPSVASEWYISSDSSVSPDRDKIAGVPGKSPSYPLIGALALKATLSSAKPGDQIRLRRGDVFFGSLKIQVEGSESNPILLSTYGEGPRPRITDLFRLMAWRQVSGNIWAAKIDWPKGSKKQKPMMLLRDGVPLALARFPNPSQTWGGYLPIFRHQGRSKIWCDSLPKGFGAPKAELVVRSRRWILDRLSLKAIKGNELSLGEGLNYDPEDGFGFFFQGYPGALDAEGEWCHDEARDEIWLYSDGTPSYRRYELASQSTLVDLSGSSGLRIVGVEICGSNDTCLRADSSRYLAMDDCAIGPSGTNGLTAYGSERLSLSNCHFTYCQNNAISLDAAKDLKVVGNLISDTGTMAGMGHGGDGTYNAIYASGQDILLEANRVVRTGYIPISFGGDRVRVRRNWVEAYAFVKDDAGGIYTWTNGKQGNFERLIEENFVHGGLGAEDGQPGAGRAANGIYVDDRSEGILVRGNVVWDVADIGIFLHNSHDIDVQENLCFDNGTQFQASRDGIAPESLPKNIRLRANRFFSAQLGQVLVKITNWYDSMALGLSFSDNLYASPMANGSQVEIQYPHKAANRLNVSEWALGLGQDPSAHINQIFLEPYTINQIGAENLVANGASKRGLESWAWWSSKSNESVSLSKSDGGQARASLGFTAPSGQDDSLLLFYSGRLSIKKGKSYLLSFFAKSSTPGRRLSFLTRRNSDPWTQSCPEISFRLSESESQYKAIFKSTASEDSSRAEFILYEPNSNPAMDRVELWDVELREVDAIERQGSEFFQLSLNYGPEEGLLGPLAGHSAVWLADQARLAEDGWRLTPFSAMVFFKPIQSKN